MADYTRVGMETYHRILQDARVNNKPIGPKYHEHNRQFKQWEARQNNLAVLKKAREVKHHKAEVRKVNKAQREKLDQTKAQLQEALNRINAVKEKLASETTLRAKYDAQRTKKLSDAYKTGNSTDRIKSSGNGL